jgi:hypothetical protein
MKLARIVDDKFHVALQKLANEPLPLKTAFKLKGISKAVKEEYSKYDEVRKEALQKHGQKNEDGTLKTDEKGNVAFDDNGLQGFVDEINELTSLEIDMGTVKISELGDNIKLTSNELDLLDGVIVE